MAKVHGLCRITSAVIHRKRETEFLRAQGEAAFAELVNLHQHWRPTPCLGKAMAGVGAGAVSANVAALTKGAANMLFWSSVKTAAIAVAVTGAVVGTGTVVAQKAIDATPSVGVESKPKTVDLQRLIRLRREGNLLACDWICPTNPAGVGRFETLNPRLSCVAYPLQTQTFGPGAAEIYGTNMAERAGPCDGHSGRSTGPRGQRPAFH
jgi:hypothetical protein